MEGVGCEKFAELCFNVMNNILTTFQSGQEWTLLKSDKKVGFKARYPVGQGVRLKSAEVFEHSGNSAIYEA